MYLDGAVFPHSKQNIDVCQKNTRTYRERKKYEFSLHFSFLLTLQSQAGLGLLHEEKNVWTFHNVIFPGLGRFPHSQP
jgi:hypothetical protein